jgi:hypothetical protein
MLYHLLYPLHSNYGVFNVFRYITFRMLIAGLTALLARVRSASRFARTVPSATSPRPVRRRWVAL